MLAPLPVPASFPWAAMLLWTRFHDSSDTGAVTDAYSVLSHIRGLWLNTVGPQKMSAD